MTAVKSKVIYFSMVAACFLAVHDIATADLIISQVYEGEKNDRYLEVSNTGVTAVSLANYKLAIWKRSRSGGDASIVGITPFYSILSGTLAAGATILYKNPSANNPAYADTAGISNASVDFDGNDAIALVDSANSIIDLFGEGLNNKDQNYSRKPDSPNASSVFTPANWTNMDFSVANNAVSTTGNYLGYYIFINLPHPELVISPDTISGLTSQPGTASLPQSYTLSGANLTAAVSVVASTGDIEISTSQSGVFVNSLTLNATGGTVSQIIYVRISATASSGFLAASLDHVSGNASAELSVSGEVTSSSKAGLRAGLDYVVANSSEVQNPNGESLITIDDTSGSVANLQALIDAARVTDPDRFLLIRLMAGATYVINNSPLTLGSKMCLSGRGSTIMAATGAAAGCLVRITGGSSFVSADRLTLDGNGADLLGIDAPGVSRVNIDRVTVRNTGRAGIFLQGLGNAVFNNEMTATRCNVYGVTNAAGIHFKDTTQSVAMENNCYNNAIGILVEASDHGSIFNNLVQYNSASGLHLRDARNHKVASNLLIGNLTGITTGGSGVASSSTYNMIFLNEFRSSQTGIYIGQSKDTIYGNVFPSGITTPIVFATGTSYNRVLQPNAALSAVSQEYFYPPTATNFHSDAVKNGQIRFDIATSANTLSAIQIAYDSARAENPGKVFVLRLNAAVITGDAPLALNSDTCVILQGRINLAPGVSAFVANGTLLNPIAFISISGGLIDGQNTSGRYGMSFTNCSKVIVEDVNLLNFGSKSTRVTGSDVILFAGCKEPCIVDSCTISGGAARGIWTKGISGSSTSGMLLIDNSISNVNMDGIDFDTATSSSGAFYNLSQNNVRYGIFVEEGAKFVQAIGNTCSGNDIGINVYSYAVGPTEKNSLISNVLSANRRGLRFGALDPYLTQFNFAFNNQIVNSTPLSGIDSQDDGSENYLSQNSLVGNYSQYGSTSTAVFFNSPNSDAASVDNATHANEDFSNGDTTANLVGQGDWATLGTSTAGAITVSEGGALLLAGPGYQAAYKKITPYQFADGTSVYIRLDINVNSASLAGSDFFLVTREIDAVSGQPVGKNYFRVYLKSSGPGFQLGWNPHAETGVTVTPPVPTYSDTVFNFNTNYKIVIRCDSVSSRNNDDTFLFVDPMDANAFPLLTRTTWTGNTDEFSATTSTSAGVRVPGYLNLVLKQSTISETPSLSMRLKNIVVANSLQDIGFAYVTESLPEIQNTEFINTITSGTVTWTGGPNWSPSAPTSASSNDIKFQGALTGDLAISNNSSGNFTLNSLTFGNTGTGNLTLADGILFFEADVGVQPGITFSGVSTVVQRIASGLSISGDLQLSSTYTSTNYPLISGQISGTGSISGTATGSAALNNITNNFTGGVWIGKGTLYAATVGNKGAPSALGSGETIKIGSGTTSGTLRFSNTSNETSDKNIDLTGTTGGGTIAGLNSTLTLNGSFMMTGAGAKTLTLGSSGSGASGVNFNGMLSDLNGILSVRINGSGNAMHSLGNDSNTFSGSVTIDGNTGGKTYTLNVVKIGNSGAASSLGTNRTIHIGNNSSSAAINVIRYVGVGETTDKVINLSGTIGGAMISNYGSGLLKFTSPFTATGSGSKNLFIDPQVADIEVAAAIVDSAGGVTSIIKNQPGTLTLSAANSFKGNAIIKGGAIKLTHAAALASAVSLDFTSTAGSGGPKLILAYSGAGPTLGSLSVLTNATIDLGSDSTASINFASAGAWTPGCLLTISNSSGGKLYIQNPTGVDTSQIKSLENPSYVASIDGNGLVVFSDPSPTATVPVVTTPSYTEISDSAAVLGGNVLNDGGLSISEFGVVYAATSVNPSPQIGGSGVTKLSGVGAAQIFTVSVGDLNQGTAYSFAAYAINSRGTAYSSVASFTTLTSIESWRLLYFGSTLNGGASADSANPDGDLLSNLLEFSFGTNPATPAFDPLFYANGTINTRGQPIIIMTQNSNPLEFNAVYCRLKNHELAGLTYTVQFCADDLTNWTDSSATPTVLASDADYEVVAVSFPQHISTANGNLKARFFRVMVSR